MGNRICALLRTSRRVYVGSIARLSGEKVTLKAMVAIHNCGSGGLQATGGRNHAGVSKFDVERKL